MNISTNDLSLVLNLVMSFILGGTIGWFREREGKTAGMRTHILVSLGSALFMTISYELMKLGGGTDPGRIAAGVVTGIGFLGAGCIIQTGSGVIGITTAASIWVTAAIGVAAGAGLYVSAVTATILTIVALQVMRQVEKHIIKTKEK